MARSGEIGGVICVDPATGAQTVVTAGGIFARPFGIAVVPASLVISVAIDVMPGTEPNTITLGADKEIMVAILSCPNFNPAAEVDALSLTFGRTGDEASLSVNRKGQARVTQSDLNGDAILDLIATFVTDKTGLQVGDTTAILKGQTVTGLRFRGQDAVSVARKPGKGGGGKR